MREFGDELSFLSLSLCSMDRCRDSLLSLFYYFSEGCGSLGMSSVLSLSLSLRCDVFCIRIFLLYIYIYIPLTYIKVQTAKLLLIRLISLGVPKQIQNLR